MDITEQDLVWAAGLFEGEGSIYISLVKRGKSVNSLLLNFAVTMTDEECVKEFNRIVNGWFGDHHLRLGKDDRRKPSYICSLSSQKALTAIKLISPFFRTSRMKEKARIAIEFQEMKRVGFPARDPEYKAIQESLHLKMKELNRRGKEAP